MLGFARIADLSLASDGKAKFTVYNIHMNGFYHCSLRYSQLLELHTELKANFDTTLLEEFPPKHVFSLTEGQQNQRRHMLERFIQSVCQNRAIGPSELVKEYWLAAQRASSEVVTTTADLEVYLVNGKKVTLSVEVGNRADQVLEQVCAQIEMNPDLTYYFGLFVERATDHVVLGPVTDYQSPYLTLQAANMAATEHRLTLRQNFWDAVFVPSLLEDKVAKNMLYIEALASVNRGHIEVSKGVLDKLAAMKSKGQKKEYLDTVCELPEFGYRQLEGFTFNHPVEGMEGCVRVGKREVVTYTPHGNGVWAQCTRYQLTKIRSWKVGHDFTTGVPWIQLNYQLSGEEFVWVQLSGELCVFLNLCLHSTVSELLRIRAKTIIRTPASQPICRSPRELPRYSIISAPSGSLEESGSEGRRSSVSSVKTRTVSEASNGHTPDVEASSPPPVSTEGASENRQPNKKPASRFEGISLFGGGKKAKSPTETENQTFNFGTDDDL